MAADASGEQVRSARTNAIIAALATILAAVIAASGGIIANRNRVNDRLEGEVGKLTDELRAKNDEIATLNNTIASLRKQAAAGGSSTGTTNPSNEQFASSRSEEEDGFQFALESCTRSGAVVTCRLTTTNTGVTRRLRLHARPDLYTNSRALTDQGVQIQATHPVLAGVSDIMPAIDLAPRIPVKLEIRFTDVPPEVKTFSLLHVAFEIGLDDHAVEFRGVAIAT